MVQEILKDIIPSEKIVVVKEVLRETFGNSHVESISQIRGGLSTALSYKILVSAKYFMLRIIVNRNAFQDPVRYFSCMKIASNAKIAPKVLYANAEHGITIVEYIEQTSEISKLPPEVQVEELAKTIKQIHSLAQFPVLIDFLTGVEMMIKNNLNSSIIPEKLLKEHAESFSKIQAKYPRNSNLVSSHNDLNPGNLLYDGKKIWVIDWESAFSADEYVDLAIVSIFFPSVGQREEMLLEKYFGTYDSYKKARFFLMKQIVYTYYSMIFFQMTNTIKKKDINFKDEEIPHYIELMKLGNYLLSTPEGQYRVGKSLLQQSIIEMRSDYFKEAIDEISLPQL